MDKQRIRRDKRERRLSLPLSFVNEASQIVQEKLYDYIKDANIIASYMPMGNEIDVNIASTNQTWVYPKVEDHARMNFYKAEHFQVSSYGIQEPADGEIIAPASINIILVPLVAFDEKGNRVGHGKGYYDRYLRNCNAIKIGIAYEFQKVDLIEAEIFDIPLDIIISEKATYKK